MKLKIIWTLNKTQKGSTVISFILKKVAYLSFVVGILLFPICSSSQSAAYSTWFAFNPDEDYSESVISTSSWLDAPAGKHGFLQMNGDELVFEDGTPLKFWGVNISSQRAFADRSDVDLWIKNLSKYGVNGVRFHKFTKYGYKEGASTKLDEDKYKKHDYFLSELKQAGIYYGWSHIYGHKVKPEDSDKLLNYDEIANLTYPWSHLNGTTSSLVNFAPDLQDLSIDLTINMLNRVNTVTGKPNAQDPALAFIELQNEDNIFWGPIEKSLKQAPSYRKLLCKQFSNWLKNKYNNQKELQKAWGKNNIPEGESLEQGNIYPAPNHHKFSVEYERSISEDRPMQQHFVDKMEFLYEKQMEFYERFVVAIRETGYKGIIVGSCWQAGHGPSHFYNLLADYNTGIIDRHNYWGGGTGHRMERGTIKTQAMVSEPGIGLLSTGMQQVADRPFSISEWISKIPNEWVAEGVPIVAMYGMGLQGWDASFQFGSDLPYFSETIHTPGVYNISSPTQMTLYPAISRMIYRNDIEEGKLVSIRNIALDDLKEGELGFKEYIKQGYDDKNISGDVPAASLAVGKAVVNFSDVPMKTTLPNLDKFWNKEEKRIKSNTGQLFWDYSDKGFFTLNTDFTKAAVGFVGGEELLFKNLGMKIKTPFAIVIVTPLEKDKNFKSSKHLLLTTVARAMNTNMKLNSERNEVLDTGEAPILLEPVKLHLSLKRSGNPTVHVLDHVGRRTGKTIPVTDKKVIIDGRSTQAIYYEIEYQ